MLLIYFIALSIIPSIIWLTFFLREDRRPEPKKTILKVFSIGMLSTVPVIVLSLAIGLILRELGVPIYLISFIGVIFVAAVVEETTKYLVVKRSVFNSSEVDEPSDLMIYAITAALGFAAMENVVFLFPGREALFGLTSEFFVQSLITGSIVRLVSGTFLHALVSGIMGYFLALSIMKTKYRKRLVWSGLAIAILLHGSYNFSIMFAGVNGLWFVVAPILLLSLFIIVLFLFSKTRKMNSICRFENRDIKNNEKSS